MADEIKQYVLIEADTSGRVVLQPGEPTVASSDKSDSNTVINEKLDAILRALGIDPKDV